MRFFASTRFVLSSFLFFVVSLFFYSFTQIDLSLTFSQESFLQTIQKSFQYIGYFNRPVSADLFLVILIGLAASYIRMLDLIRKKKISLNQIVFIIATVSVLLTLTYNAFSYDLFNYIFDAKIVTMYQENPYLKKALDYPSDPMLSFMRWTHRTYPYGPVWLGLTIPLSYAGMQIFAVTFGLFKLLALASFLGSCYFLYRILKVVKDEEALFGTAFFALNPLVLTESLISSHNDITMLFLMLVSIYFAVWRRMVVSLLFLGLSIGLKFATIFLFPVYGYILYLIWKKETIRWERIFILMFLCMTGAVVAATFRTNFQPWYLLYILPFVALLSYRKYFFSPFILLSVTSLLNYLPFLFSGNWDDPIPLLLNNLNITASIVATIMLLLLLKQERKKA